MAACSLKKSKQSREIKWVWKNKKHHHYRWKIKIRSSGDILHSLMFSSQGFIFYPKWSLCLSTSCTAHTFPYLHRLNSPHKHSTRSWSLTGHAQLTPGPVARNISEGRFCLLSYWSLFEPTSGVGSVCPSTPGMVWPFLKSVQFTWYWYIYSMYIIRRDVVYMYTYTSAVL